MSNRKRDSAPVPTVFNLEAEQAVLGCVLRRDSVYYIIQNDISASDFYDPRHRVIWTSIVKIARSSKGGFNAATVSDFLHGDTEGEAVERDYLEALADAVSDPTEVNRYVRAVIDLARRRAAMMAMQDGIERLRLIGPEDDLAEIIDAINGDILDRSRSDSATLKTLGEYGDDVFRRIDDAWRNRARLLTKFDWGLAPLDEAAGPLLPGQLAIIGGRPEMGKSALATTIALALGRQAPGAIFSLEMTGQNVADRSISHLTEIPAWRLTKNECGGTRELGVVGAAIEELHRLPVWVEARPGLTREQIRAKMIGLARRHGCRWFLVDHIQIVGTSYRRQEDVDKIDLFCRDQAALAKELNAVMIALSQVNSKNRDAIYDRPQSRHLMYYTSIEPHADRIIFPYRREVALRDQKPPDPVPGDEKAEKALDTWRIQLRELEGRAEMFCTKNRHGPSGESRPCRWNGPLMRFEPLTVGKAAKADVYEADLAGAPF